MALQAPTVTIDDLHAFHAKHFPHAPTPEQFLHGVAQDATEEYHDEEDDGLGYYSDGTKRTITDEQIAMFRHSEIQAILRKRRLRREAGELSEEGEVETEPKDAASSASASTPGHTTRPKAQQWATSSDRTKKRNKKNRDKYKVKKREMKLERERTKKDGRLSPYHESESDEWDPWHQANGPDVQKEDKLELDY
ncbi:hypothetical protein HBH56_089240 [Parastagonospora nodorum]|uniref:Uncharacterized protein n=1 Tax=Phaeosphaeria nodorum (strain SN15 / ATCC MYA-4574 / FGSC 10173) TaxID=321614 RepID=A0A7U2I3L5_PHANO|nr:hypothetical protein HBH56_089240 [Parastagonospora nodorum]QRC98127.1 hypothetical protein JI435_042270 [Parastagonospora nodorum SN15]KAH3936667.1 hypothetical protein HBH54_023880 [Parastagonospora nodorum]KAH3945801.1 hypothetical protein HBH53_140980 [Parastagonospora nodorum]KAH3966373.1 hypothetical protein HBH51_144390 [Parastagonospora nodorum]